MSKVHAAKVTNICLDCEVARMRVESMRRNYGLSPADYNAMLSTQGGVCAICGGPPSGRGATHQRYFVDHDHSTGAVRGLLCHHCNAALGHLRDSPELLEVAAEYLRRHALVAKDR
jgi:hypothetical protein